MTAILIFVKYPEPGKVKTRLGTKIGYETACAFYRLFLEKTFATVLSVDVDEIFLACEPQEKLADFQEFAPGEFSLFPQNGLDLGERLNHAFAHVFSKGFDKVLAIGSDSPTLPRRFLSNAFNALDDNDLVIGPAKDGGYYLIGMKQLHNQLFRQIEWSTESVLPSTIQRAVDLDLSYVLLDEWYDVDDLLTLQQAAIDDTSGGVAEMLEHYSLSEKI